MWNNNFRLWLIQTAKRAKIKKKEYLLLNLYSGCFQIESWERWEKLFK